MKIEHIITGDVVISEWDTHRGRQTGALRGIVQSSPAYDRDLKEIVCPVRWASGITTHERPERIRKV